MGPPPTKYPIEEVLIEINKFIERAKLGEVKPRLISFRAEYGIGKTRLWELSKIHTELADSVEKLHTMEEEHIVQGGESGGIPAAFAKFRLQQKPFNYSDKTEVTYSEKKLEDYLDG